MAVLCSYQELIGWLKGLLLAIASGLGRSSKKLALQDEVQGSLCSILIDVAQRAIELIILPPDVVHRRKAPNVGLLRGFAMLNFSKRTLVNQLDFRFNGSNQIEQL